MSENNENFESLSQQPDASGAEVISGVETAVKKKKPIVLIIVIILAVLAAGSAAAYNFVPSVKNAVKMQLNDPEDYYLWVEEENMSDTIDAVSEAYGKMFKSQGMEMELKADLEKDAINSLLSEMTDPSGTGLPFTVPGNVSIKLSSGHDKNSASAVMTVSADDKTLATLDMLENFEDGAYYYKVPELSDGVIKMNLSDIMAEAMQDEQITAENPMYGMMESLEAIMKNPNSLEEYLSEKELNELLTKYSKIVFENLSNVDLKKGEKCEAGGLKTEYNALYADIDTGVAQAIAKDVLKEAKNDKTIIKLVEKFEITTEDEYKKAVDELLGQLGDIGSIEGGKTFATLITYVDSKGVIQGRTLDIAELEGEEIGYLNVKDGKDVACEINFVADDEGVSAVVNAAENGDKYSGDITVKVISEDIVEDNASNPTFTDETAFTVNFKDFETVNKDKGLYKGEFTIDLSAFDLGGFTLKLDSDGKQQSASTDITVNDTKYATITLSMKESDNTSFSSIDPASATIYNFTSDGAELQEYIESAKLEDFVKNIGSAFGMSDDVINSFLNGFNGTQPVDDVIDDFDDDLINDGETDPDNGNDDEIGIEDGDEDYSGVEAEYDFSKLSTSYNGKDVKIPSKIDGIFDLVDTSDVDKVEPNYTKYLTSEDYSFSVIAGNQSDTAAELKDCVTCGITVYGSPSGETPKVDFKVNGFGIGSNAEEVAKAFGTKLENDDLGSILITDSNSPLNNLTFSYMDGVIYQVSYSVYEY